MHSLFLSLALLLCFLMSGKESSRIDLHARHRTGGISPMHRAVSAGTGEGREYLTLSEDLDEGVAWLNDVTFSTGVIELELKGQDVMQRSFLGVAFHGADDSTFEAVYFRPFHFRSDDPVRKGRRVQYISLPRHPWRTLRERHPGHFENTVEPAPDPNGWFRAKIAVTDTMVTVFVNGAAEPCLRVRPLSGRKSGRIGLYAADRSGGSYANLSIRER